MTITWMPTILEMPKHDDTYFVVIRDCDTMKDMISACKFSVTKNKFHFDMPHINWRVVKWGMFTNYEDLKWIKKGYSNA